MRNGYNIVAVTAAGRRQYMKFLIPHILKSDMIDRYDIWVNTMSKLDIAFFKELENKYSKVNLVYQPDGKINGIASINAFYKYCVDPKSIYLKLDDDIIWMDNNALCTLVDYRINNPEYFLVSPIIINNGLCAYALYNSGKLKLSRYLKAYMEDVAGWCSPKFSEKYHRWFYDIIKSNCVEDVMISNKEIAMNRFSINAVSFFGSSFNEFSGEVVGDDEEFLSVVKPTSLGCSNCFVGNSIMVHYAFSSQKKYLDGTDILKLYDEYYVNMKFPYYSDISSLILEIESLDSLDEYVQDLNYVGIKKSLKEKLGAKKFYLPVEKRFYEFYVNLFRPIDLL